jgi:hypothetical protein
MMQGMCVSLTVIPNGSTLRQYACLWTGLHCVLLDMPLVAYCMLSAERCFCRCPRSGQCSGCSRSWLLPSPCSCYITATQQAWRWQQLLPLRLGLPNNKTTAAAVAAQLGVGHS